MRVVCGSCGRTVPIADDNDRLVGVSVYCGCGAILLTDGQVTGGGMLGHEGRESMMPTPRVPPNRPGQWLVRFSDTVRGLTIEELVEEYREGRVDEKTYAWKPGMVKWYPVLEIPHLRLAMQVDRSEAEAPPSSRARLPEAMREALQAALRRSAAMRASSPEEDPLLQLSSLSEPTPAMRLNEADLPGSAVPHPSSMPPRTRSSFPPPLPGAELESASALASSAVAGPALAGPTLAGPGQETSSREDSARDIAARDAVLQGRGIDAITDRDSGYGDLSRTSRPGSIPPVLSYRAEHATYPGEPQGATPFAITRAERVVSVEELIDAELVGDDETEGGSATPAPMDARRRYRRFFGVAVAAAAFGVFLGIAAQDGERQAREPAASAETVRLGLQRNQAPAARPASPVPASSELRRAVEPELTARSLDRTREQVAPDPFTAPARQPAEKAKTESPRVPVQELRVSTPRAQATETPGASVEPKPAPLASEPGLGAKAKKTASERIGSEPVSAAAPKKSDTSASAPASSSAVDDTRTKPPLAPMPADF